MHNHNDMYSFGAKTAVTSICINSGLCVLKFAAGILGRSHAMLADAVHTASDLLTSVAVLVGFKIAKRPADLEHPYGHGRAESIVAKLVAFVLICLGVKVGWDSMYALREGGLHRPHVAALWAAILSILVKEGLFRYSYRRGKKISSTSLVTDAWHHRSDAISSVAALIGIGGARLGFSALDPLAGIAVSILVIKVGLQNFHSAYDELMDSSLPKEITDNIKNLTLQIEGVKRVKDIKTRKLGLEILIDLIIEVDGQMTVNKSHAITAMVRKNILDKVPNVRDLMIHVEPC
ncbi:MAG: cation transporter [Candidatus Omnitrophica bacterium]|nr:cation transporter [Candidatus Omnitrophota bacterium]